MSQSRQRSSNLSQSRPHLSTPSHKKIKAGKTSVVVHVTAQGDMGGESKRTVKLVLVGGDAYTTDATAVSAKVKLLLGN